MKRRYVIKSLKTGKYFDWYWCEWWCVELDIENIRNWLYDSIEDAQNNIVQYEDLLDWEIIEIKKILIIN